MHKPKTSPFLKCNTGSDGFQKLSIYNTWSYTKNDTITLFAFDPGEGLSEYKELIDAIASIIDGEASGGVIWMIYEDQ